MRELNLLELTHVTGGLSEHDIKVLKMVRQTMPGTKTPLPTPNIGQSTGPINE